MTLHAPQRPRRRSVVLEGCDCSRAGASFTIWTERQCGLWGIMREAWCKTGQAGLPLVVGGEQLAVMCDEIPGIIGIVEADDMCVRSGLRGLEHGHGVPMPFGVRFHCEHCRVVQIPRPETHEPMGQRNARRGGPNYYKRIFCGESSPRCIRAYVAANLLRWARGRGKRGGVAW